MEINSGRHYTKNEMARIKRLSKKYTARQVAERMGRSPAAIQAIANLRGIKFGTTEYHKHTTREVKTVLALRREGKVFREIGELTGLNPHSCRYLWRRYSDAQDLVHP